MTSLLMKPTSAGKDTQHELGQTLKKLACVSNQWGPLLASVCRDCVYLQRMVLLH